MSGDLSLLLASSAKAVRDNPVEARARFKAAAKRNDPNPPCPHCGKRHRTLTEDQCADRSMSEKTLQARVVDRAKRRGWKVAHAGRAWVGDSETGAGQFVTPMSPGWPDLFLVKPTAPPGRRAIAIELKREQGEVEPEQWEWLELLNACGIPAVVVRPSDLREGRVNAILEGR